MNQSLKKLKDIQAKACVSILLNTHRTHPDNVQDAIALKNLQKQAEARLLEAFDKRFAQPIIDKINTIADGINHDYNLDSLAIYVNENMAEFVRLPIAVEERVVLDESFATRDLIRAMHQTSSYYVLALSRDKARLIEASSDKLVAEVKQGIFPMKNRNFGTSAFERSMDKGSDNLFEEFFNRVDKAVKLLRSQNPLPVFICTEERNLDHYLKVADDKSVVLGHLNKAFVDDEAQAIVSESWPHVLEITKKNNEARIAELKKAVSEGKFFSDFNEIWTAVNSGKAKTLFASKDLFQPARVKEDASLELLPLDEATVPGVIDDIIDEMAEATLRFGGEVLFLEHNALDDFQGLGLVTRY